MNRLPLLLVLAIVVAACGSESAIEDKEQDSACDGLFDGDTCDLGGGLCLEIVRSGAECEPDPGVCESGLCVPLDEADDPNDGDNPDDPNDGDDPDDPTDGDDPDDPNDGDDPDDPNDGDDPNDPLCLEDDCDDDNECTVGGCEDDACVFTPVEDGEVCGDGGTCQEGECLVPVAPDPTTIEQELSCKLGLLPIKVPMTLTVAPEAPFVAGEPTRVTTSVTATLTKWIAKLAIKAHHHTEATVTLGAALAEIGASGTDEEVVYQTFQGLPTVVEFADENGDRQENVIDSGDFTQVVTPGASAAEVDFQLVDASGLITDVPVFGEIAVPGLLHCRLDRSVSATFDVGPSEYDSSNE